MVLTVPACYTFGGCNRKNKKVNMMNIKKFMAAIMAVVLVTISSIVDVSAETYTTKAGDSWYKVAAEYNISAKDLAAANGKTLEDVLLKGKEIEIPSSGSSTNLNDDEYVVKPNDSWYRIAENLGISPTKLAEANGKTLESVIVVGEKLQIPNGSNSSSSNGNGSKTTSSYTVQEGESWWSIATKFGVTSTSLAKINGRTVEDTIYAGETIAIPNKGSAEDTHNMSSSVLSSITLCNTPSGNSWYNIQLAAAKLNGLQVKSGESFSWATYMGACGKEQGYLEAGVYQNGKPAKGYGGGVCFVSTCLMQSARAAGLQIDEKHDHSRPVKYATRGNEASVSYGAWDMRFTNTTNSTVVFSVSTSSSGACTVTCSKVG